MVIAANLGYPRIGANRELKRAVESYWSGKIGEDELALVAAKIRSVNWQYQFEQGIRHIPSNDFSLYDQVLDTAIMVGAIPDRYGFDGGSVSLSTYFAMARGVGVSEDPNGVAAMEMTKWFDTNYHYIVPEFEQDQSFTLTSLKCIDEFLEAKKLGIHTRPVILGPISFLLLGKYREGNQDKLSLLDNLIPVYEDLFKKLVDVGVDWIQVDEPFLGLDLDADQRAVYNRTYTRLAEAKDSLSILLTVYFSDLRDNLETAIDLPVEGLHVDLVRGFSDLDALLAKWPTGKFLSLGLIDGRNVWKTDLDKALDVLNRAVASLGSENVLIAPSCSLLHSPVDLDFEVGLDREMKSWLAFARQKIEEIAILAKAVNSGEESVESQLAENAGAMESRRNSTRIHSQTIKDRVGKVVPSMMGRSSPFSKRQALQREALDLPIFPTTTIGSFPQTRVIRKARADYRSGVITEKDYDLFLKEEIAETVRFQEHIGLDVLVHGEAERNDMVEYFGEQLSGNISTQNGWVQSYGSRCVKPPIIFGDVGRLNPMTVDWITYAQSLTNRPVKGMLTGPITMLQWSFVRDDQPRSETAQQIALAIRDEVKDLETAGIGIIQIDEPALREGLPLRQADWILYLRWAVDCFRLAASGVKDVTQIHTHMCYAEFNDIIEAIGELDADVISVESSRSDMELFQAFGNYRYPNEIGPGVYDIHSPRVANTEEMEHLLSKALEVLSSDQLWVNPDCGLKTRGWEEVELSLQNMVRAASVMREKMNLS